MPSNDSFLEKYRKPNSNGNSNRNTPVSALGASNYNNFGYNSNNNNNNSYNNGYSNGFGGGNYMQSHNDLTANILCRAGPSHVYQRPDHIHEVSNVTTVTTEVTQNPGRSSARYGGGSAYQYRINEDPQPIRMERPLTPVTQRQSVHVRYLRAPTPPQPHPIIVRERQLTPPPPAPPIVIRQIQKPPPTPPPLIIRERPPAPPEMPKAPTIIEKIIPPPTPPPRQVIIERIPAPPKPRQIIYEKWMPHPAVPARHVIVEKARIHEKQPTPRNVIIEYEHHPNSRVQQHVQHEGVHLVSDPANYQYSRDIQNAEVQYVDSIEHLPAEPASSGGAGGYWPTWQQQQQQQRAQTPQMRALTPKTSSMILNMKSQPTGPPYSYSGPWNTTYKSSYTGRGYENNWRI